MKILYLHGAPVDGQNRFDENQPVVKIYITRFGKKLVIEAIPPAPQSLANEVTRRIQERLDRMPEAPFLMYVKPDDPNVFQAHDRVAVKWGDPLVLEAIRESDFLWGHFDPVAGYYILPTYSKVVNEGWF